MKRIILIAGLFLSLILSCNTFADTCDGYTASYVTSCNNMLYGDGCGNYYTIIDGNKYGCGIIDPLNDLYCDTDLSHMCDTDDNCTNPTKNLGIFNFGTEVVGDVVNTWIIDYMCEGNKYYTCFWNNTVPAVIPDIVFYNRNSLTINSTYSNTDFFTDYSSELPATEYSPGFIINCNNTYVCVSNSSEVNESTMIETTHYYSVIITSTNCSTTTSTTTTSTTEGTTTSTGGATTSTGGVTTSVAPGTTMYGYSLPNTNYGTLPGLNGTGGITINNGTIKNMTCTGWCIIGLKKEEFTLYAAIMISLLVLFAVKPVKLGATASFVAVAFFNNILGWTVVTTSVMLIYAIVAFGAWFTEGKE